MKYRILSVIVAATLAGCGGETTNPPSDSNPPIDPNPTNPIEERVDVIPVIPDGNDGTNANNPINQPATDFYPQSSFTPTVRSENCRIANAPNYCSGSDQASPLLSAPSLGEDLTVYERASSAGKSFEIVSFDKFDGINSMFIQDHDMLRHVFKEMTEDLAVNSAILRLLSTLSYAGVSEITSKADLGGTHLNAILANEYAQYAENGVQPTILSSAEYDSFPSNALSSYGSLNAALNQTFEGYTAADFSRVVSAADAMYLANQNIFTEISLNDRVSSILPAASVLEDSARTYRRLLSDGSFDSQVYPKLEIKSYQLSSGDAKIPDHYVTTKGINVGKFSDSSQHVSSSNRITHKMASNYLAQYIFLNSVYKWNEDFGANFSYEDLRDGKYRAIYHGFAQYFSDQNFANPAVDNDCNPFATSAGACAYPNNYGSYGLMFEVLMSGAGGTPASSNSAINTLLNNLKKNAFSACQGTPLVGETDAEMCIREAFDSAGFVDSVGDPVTVEYIQSNWSKIKSDYIASGATSDSLGVTF